ncbi:MAG: hypothetical protein FWC50_08900 [Planctomycetaceae bacterium]|nr:hypothetical protein [Planctomycetaceae bacterium]
MVDDDQYTNVSPEGDGFYVTIMKNKNHDEIAFQIDASSSSLGNDTVIVLKFNGAVCPRGKSRRNEPSTTATQKADGDFE